MSTAKAPAAPSGRICEQNVWPISILGNLKIIDSTQSDTVLLFKLLLFSQRTIQCIYLYFDFFLCEGYMNSNINFRAVPFC